MKSIASLVILLLFSSLTFAQLSVINNKKETYRFAFAYFYSGIKTTGWISEGWKTIEPGDTLQLTSKNPREKFIYYYATSASDTLKGYKKMLVDPVNNFQVTNAIMQTTKDANPTFEFIKFREVKRGLFRKYKRQSFFYIGD